MGLTSVNAATTSIPNTHTHIIHNQTLSQLALYLRSVSSDDYRERTEMQICTHGKLLHVRLLGAFTAQQPTIPLVHKLIVTTHTMSTTEKTKVV